MKFLTQTQKTSLREQIQQAESNTTAEIVTVIANQSDGYRYIPMLWAAIISLSLPGMYFLYQHVVNAGWQYPHESISMARWYMMQVLTFLGLGTLFQFTKLRLWLIPKSVKSHRAQRHAHEQFFVQKLHLTEHGTGVLIFVSVAEHYVEIIVDKAIADAIDNSVWQETIDEFIQHIRNGDIAAGFASTVSHCTEVLTEHFPAQHERPDELSNHLIEIFV